MLRGKGNFTRQRLAGLVLLGILAAGLKRRSRTLFSPGEYYPGGKAGRWADRDPSDHEEKQE